MSFIVDIGRSDSVKIHNPNDQGNPLAVQIPADLLYSADVVFREMCMRGEESPRLSVRRTIGPSGSTVWLAEYGGLRGFSMTPWGAIRDLARKIEMPF